MSLSMRRLSTIVAVAVIAGAIEYHFGDATGILSAGMSKTFAAEQAGLPDRLAQQTGIQLAIAEA